MQMRQTISNGGPAIRLEEQERRKRSKAARSEWTPPPRSSAHGAATLARGLGWFSIGLGLAQIFAPRGVAKLIGVRPDRRTQNTMMAIGAREIAAGLAIMKSPGSSTGLWMRVGGDLMDLFLLGSAARGAKRVHGGHLGAAIAAVGGVLLVDTFAAKSGDSTDFLLSSEQERTEVITINRSAEEVYRFWRNFQNLPLFMAHLDEVQVLDERRSAWKVTGPAGRRFEWTAEIVEDKPNERIGWRSLDGSDVHHSGKVEFMRAPGNRGTLVRLQFAFGAPGGKIGTSIAKLFGKDPGQMAKSDLRRLKQVLETGEVVHSDASIHRGMHPARPSAEQPQMLVASSFSQEVQS